MKYRLLMDLEVTEFIQQRPKRVRDELFAHYAFFCFPLVSFGLCSYVFHPMTVRVKICGLTNRDDAQAAIDSGADALGFIFCATSPRCLDIARAAKILDCLPPFITKVAVFANQPDIFVNQVIHELGIDTLQFHGEETPEFCGRFARRKIKAFRVRDETSLKEMPQFQNMGWLLDSYVEGKLGGTGERFNWDLALQATELGPHVILAGGLTPENVADAVRHVRPFAVDVSSGVEASPGRKDHRKVSEFVRAAKAAV